ncbi:Imidazolonepropionase [Ralstonia mannitolilytica]|uniref:Imidazolonepropionase n=2 Tax=Ralstonia mannitolilytica TaxID=105219 RepID=A0AAJ4ZN32_9RALS|nr:imidazolonepropionase [Ralstonia mannitolilytica]CAG2144062.1 Imidazolonepropionase [Ralstonia mannitolilytica]CAJ0724084.1 Imidazolonepropionase [Ralstonia mannitolilytica]SUD88685.1 Imidazolonepropionase [Ralstonia mannitolilytica]SUD94648.1 Imidazolonepropionase [Ralstonia mannitolilytica]SUD98345.1 Imidazolonepropionase [Ralstonia mannitolilytica]
MTDMHWDALWTNVHLATLAAHADGYGEIRDGAIAVKDGRIAWLGARADLPPNARATGEHDGGGAWLTPGLIDCHTHLVYAGNRSNEFEARLNGVPYEEIARGGGGIVSTVRATRAASEEALAEASLPRLNALRAEGVTTVEIKSGYGLDLETERRMLRVARRFGQTLPVRVRTTFLGAHAVPPEFAGRADDYIDHLCADVLPALAADGLVDAVDAFCETIGFSPAQTARMFDAAQRLGLPVKLHAEQLSDQGGAALVARYGGLSADHLECLTAEGIAAMARAGTVAVLLPGAFYCLRETRLPPVTALREAGVPLAVSTDCNPGTSPLTSLLLAMNMACTLFRLTPLEALTGATRHAAAALGLSGTCGVLAPGYAADFALWRIDRPADLAYAMGFNPSVGVVKDGVAVA